MTSFNHATYWQSKLEAPLTPLDLPTDKLRPAQISCIQKTYKKTSVIELDGKSLLINHAASMDAILLTAFLVWIHFSSNEKDILIGHNLPSQASTMPFRLFVEPDESIDCLLDRVQKQIIEDHNNEYDSHASSVKELLNSFDASRPSFSAIFDSRGIIKVPALSDETDIRWHTVYAEQQLTVEITYNSILFTEASIERFAEQYNTLLASILSLDSTKDPVKSLSMLTAQEQALYRQLNETKLNYPSYSSIPDLFRKAAAAFPDRTALSTDSAQIAYRELDHQSDIVANMLLANGLQKGHFVSILMERSIETIISILGTLKAGGAYVPIDPFYPKERCKYLLNDTGSSMILTKRVYAPLLNSLMDRSETNCTAIFMDEPLILGNKAENMPSIEPDNLAYVIYTSGSTGKPKGTLLTHRNVTNLVESLFKIYGCTEKDVYTQFFSFSFDPSVAETFMTLFSGARLHLLTEIERVSIEDFAVAIERIQVTGIILPTAFFNQLAMHLPSTDGQRFKTVKHISMGGEALIGSMVRQWQNKVGTDMEILNLYGPTECTVISTMGRVEGKLPAEQSNIPIGKPLGNYEAFILNPYGQLAPINVPGELCISGKGLAKGYWQRPEKTAEVFVPHPFSGRGTMYRTGDMARLLPSGEIEFIGRKDSQIKVRGFRIEIGEIEDVMTRQPDINEAVIIPRKGQDNNNILYAVYTSSYGEEIEEETIRTFLGTHMPEYMIPSYFFHLDSMPLAPTGKIDRKKLAEIDYSLKAQNKKSFTAPETATQRLLAEGWEKALGLKQIGIHDDFFRIGGHSLKILQILVQVKKQFSFLKIQDFYQHRTIAAMEQFIFQHREQPVSPADEENRHGEIRDLAEPTAPLFDSAMLPELSAKAVLLTGATGYLGSHLLYELLYMTDLKIYCIIRPKEGLPGIKRLQQQMAFYFGSEVTSLLLERVIIVDADLAKEGLGMEPGVRDELVASIGSIIHCGADVRHFGETAHFQSVNVEGTLQLLELAIEKPGIQFHHISTIGIPEDLAHSGQWEHYRQSGDFDYSVTLENVYTQSKLQAEEAVRQAALNKHLPVNIYRVGNLSCHSKKGYFQKNMDENAFYRMVKAMLHLKKAPDVHWFIDIAPVDYVSKAIIALSQSTEQIGHTYHLCNPVQISHDEFIEHLSDIGYKIETLELEEYERWLLNGSHSPAIQPYLELAISQLEGEGTKNSDYRFSAAMTKEIVQGLGINCALPNRQLIQLLIDYGVKTGYFPAALASAFV